jgi:hypothetical protein
MKASKVIGAISINKPFDGSYFLVSMRPVAYGLNIA